jgi:hypothetical protein
VSVGFDTFHAYTIEDNPLLEDHLDKGHNLHKNRLYIEPQLLSVHDSKTSVFYVVRKREQKERAYSGEPEMKYI